MLRQFFILYGFLLLLTVSVMGFRGCKSSRSPLELFPDMDRQPKRLAQAANPFFADGRVDRPKVPGTVPTMTEMGENYPHLVAPGSFYENAYFTSGRNDNGDFGDGLPIEITNSAMDRGEEYFNRFCTVCHGLTGDGNGVMKDPRYGFATIASLLDQRIVDQSDGEIFNTITWGKNTMGPYGAKLHPEQRWDVVLYVRALQRAANASIDDVPVERRGELGL